MPRPCCKRHIAHTPQARLFKPAGIPALMLEEVVVTLDELESLRLADLEGEYQESAAEKMGVSRATFGRIVAGARRKVAQALVEGKALRMAGGPITLQCSAEPCGGRRCKSRGCRESVDEQE